MTSQLHRIALWIGIFAAASLPASAEGPFRELTFDAALAEAKKHERPVFVDFYTTWCGPCKMLDRSTWKDEAVISFLKEKTVALKIDAEKEIELAKKYRVTAYPSLVFIKPDGSEMGRLMGYRDGAMFLKEAEDLLKGITPLKKARDAVQGDGAKDPMKRMRYGDELAQAGRFDAALQEFLWCWDHGSASPGFGGVRSSFLLSRIGQLAQEHPPAKSALAERLDKAEAAALADPADFAQIVDATALARSTGARERMLKLYDGLRVAPNVNSIGLSALRSELIDDLMALQRYADIADHAPDEQLKGLINQCRETAARFKDQKNSPVEYVTSLTRTRGAQYIEAALRLDRADQARALARQLLEFNDADATRAAIVEAATRAQKPEFAAEFNGS